MDQARTLREAVNRQIITKDYNARVIAVSSGKGGVGKSNISLNLAVELSKRNKRVVIFDADFGLANIEILAGISPKHTFADVLRGRMIIQEIIITGPAGINLISGGSGIIDFIKTGDAKINFILENFSTLDRMYDIILVDTGAGVSDNVLNFIRASQETIIVATPEPTSITDAYALLKTVFHVSREEELPKFNIIVNKTDDAKEGHEIFNKLYSVCNNFLRIELNLLGFIPNDHQLLKANKLQQPAVLNMPKSPFSKAIENIAENILTQNIKLYEEASGISTFMKRLVSIFKV